jgi:hypothetical protein
MLHNDLLHLSVAQHVSGTVMPIIRSSILYITLQRVAHGTVKMETEGIVVSVVWCCEIDVFVCKVICWVCEVSGSIVALRLSCDSLCVAGRGVKGLCAIAVCKGR